jgi:hypothetical protein
MDFKPTTEEKEVGSIGVIYGTAGIGKTTTIATAVKEAGVKGVFISCGEDGLSPLQQAKDSKLKGVQRIPHIIKSWPDLVEAVRWVAKESYEVVAFDSVSLIMNSLEEYCFDKYFTKDPTSHGNSMTPLALKNKAYGFAKSGLIPFMADEWKTFIDGVQYLSEVKKMKVLISSHTALKKAKIVTEELEYDFGDLDMPQTKHVHLSDMLTDISDYVLYGKRDVSVFKGKTKNSAGGSNDRVFCTQESPMYKAKNRYGMEEEIPAEWPEIKKYL